MAIKTAPVDRPSKEVRLEAAREALKQPSGERSSGRGVRVTLVVPADVVAFYKSGGRFYQTRMVDALRRGME
jgi:uncharacterized protein (DUF4415 family)